MRLHEENMGVHKEISRFLSYTGHTGHPAPSRTLAQTSGELCDAGLSGLAGWNRQSTHVFLSEPKADMQGSSHFAIPTRSCYIYYLDALENEKSC